MEKISRKIVQCIDENITLDNSQKEIINFGLQATLEISLNLLISILVLFELHMIKEGVVFFLVFIPLRKYSGGYHADTYIKCFIISILTLITIMKVSNVLKLSYIIVFALIIITSCILWKIGPACVAGRPVSNREYLLLKGKLSTTLICIIFLAVFFILIKEKVFLNVIFLSICLDAVTVVIGKIKYHQ